MLNCSSAHSSVTGCLHDGSVNILWTVHSSVTGHCDLWTLRFLNRVGHVSHPVNTWSEEYSTPRDLFTKYTTLWIIDIVQSALMPLWVQQELALSKYLSYKSSLGPIFIAICIIVWTMALMLVSHVNLVRTVAPSILYCSPLFLAWFYVILYC